MSKRILFGVFLAGAFTWAAQAADLVVHEWGTITTIHDFGGKAQTGLNKIDASEVLPDFVHRYEPEHTRHDPAKAFAKSPLVPGRPDVNMRLETPVIYFHPPAGAKFEQPFDVEVRFRGGILNEFYPAAEPAVRVDTNRITEKIAADVLPGLSFDVLNNYVVSSLEWRGVRIHDTVVAPLTDNPVWTAAREVQAGSVFIPDAGEGERYIFYRGVAHLDALLQTKVSAGQVRLAAPQVLTWLEAPTLTVPNVWLADIRVDGTVAFREHGPVTITKAKAGAELARVKRFGGSDYSAEGRKQLRASLKRALLKQGLYSDEAEAMLNTWRESYFEKPGLRLFYVVPREWVDWFLPLKLSVPARLNRAIIGRVDFTGS
jgi:hypothetical protein